MMTLQDVIDAAVTCPERYGRQVFFLNRYTLNCPIAKEVLHLSDYGGNYIATAAHRLGVTEDDIWAFVRWWDGRTAYPSYEVPAAVATLSASGYRVP